MKTVQSDTFHKNYVCHHRLDELSLFKPISRNWIETCMNSVPSTFRCFLYIQMYFVVSLLKIQSTSEGTLIRRKQESVSVPWGIKKGTKYIQKTFMYFGMYCVLSIVLCTFKYALKGTTLNVR
jgi:hypothetical protein